MSTQKKRVLTEEEWMESIRGVIQRDYFPLPFDQHTTSTLPSLDKFLQTNTSEDNAAFASLQQSQVREFEAKFPPKPHQLALQNSTATLLLKDKEEHEQRREINPKAVQALYPYTQSTPPRVTPASVAYKQRQRKKSAPALSQHSLALVAKLRANNKS